MSRAVTLDVRNMMPPEPLMLVFDTIEDFTAGDRLSVIIDCHPLPLFKMLKRDGYAWEVKPGTESNYIIDIWRAA